jgi:serine/threonine protein kinase/WD40 repeat protein
MVTHDSGQYDLLDQLADEFAARYRRGERPSLKEYVDKYPDLAGDIREVFPAMVEIEQAEQDRREPPERPASPTPLPRQVGDYRILREVGRGGMGAVYEAEQQSLGRRVALKVLPLPVANDGKALERFRREARAAAKLHHTNIVPVFEVGQDGAVCFYAMQFIQGQGIDQVIEELRRLRRDLSGSRGSQPCTPSQGTSPGADAPGLPVEQAARSLLTGRFTTKDRTRSYGALVPVSPSPRAEGGEAKEEGCPFSSRAEADTSSSAVLPGETQLSSVELDHRHYSYSVARIGHQTATALAYAHARGIVHRDIKPSNLLLDASGVVWVTDFGLAKTDDDGLTNPGDIVGTLRYMAPERFRGECDGRADVYALGLTLYELLLLRPAFSEHDRLRLIEQVKEQEPARPRSLDRRVPRDLEIIVLKAIRKDPRRRYQSADELVEDLRRFLAGEPIKARRTGELERFRLWCRRQPAVAALTAVVLLLLLTVAVSSMALTVRLGTALDQSEKDRDQLQRAEVDGKYKLWEAYLAQARASRMSRQPGQRFNSLRAIRQALALPVPPRRSRDELRTEASAALCLPDLEPAKEWGGWPLGSEGFAMDAAFERYARGDEHGNVSIGRIGDDRGLLSLPGVGPILGYRGLEFSPDRRFLHQISQVKQGLRARLWKLQGPRPVAVLDDDHVAFAFRPDSRQLAAGYTDGSIRLYDLESGREVRRFSLGKSVVESLLWNPRLPQIALGSGSAWRLLDVDNGKVQPEVPVPGGISWADWHPEGRLLAVSGRDWRIYLYDTSSRRLVLPPLEGHKNGGVIARFNQAGDRLVSTDWNGLWRLWDVRTGQQLLTQPATGYWLHFSPDDRLLGSDVSGQKVRLFRFRGGEEFRTLVHYDKSGRGHYMPWGIPVLDPKGRLLATGARDGVALVDIERGEEVALLKIPDNAPLGFEPTGALLTGGPDGILRWPVADEPKKGRRRYGPPERLLRSGRLHFQGISADGQVVASPTGHGAVVLHRRDRRIVQLGPQPDVRNCAVSPDGLWVATGSHGPQKGPGVKVWEARSGKHVRDLPAGVHGSCRFSSDGKWLLTAGGGCRLWAVGTWQEGPDLGGISLNASGAFSSDSKLVALGDTPGVVRLVVVDTGKEIARLTAPEQTRLIPCCFTPDGAQLITAGPETLALHIFNLRAIRGQLAELGVDWDALPLPPAAPAPRDPLHIRIAEGDFRQRFSADDWVCRSVWHVRKKEYEPALLALRRAIALDPSHATAHNDLAWLLLVGPRELRDPKEALALARKAIELAPRRLLFYDTLGVALYRNRQLDDAVTALEKSLEASRGRADAFDLFFLAMCHHRLGAPAKAKSCYDRAVRWFQAKKAQLPADWVEELSEFQAEADVLLRGSAPKPERATLSLK